MLLLTCFCWCAGSFVRAATATRGRAAAIVGQRDVRTREALPHSLAQCVSQMGTGMGVRPPSLPFSLWCLQCSTCQGRTRKNSIVEPLSLCCGCGCVGRRLCGGRGAVKRTTSLATLRVPSFLLPRPAQRCRPFTATAASQLHISHAEIALIIHAQPRPLRTHRVQATSALF